MTKTVVTKMSPLSNVVGRVDYISNPKRQENLLAFYQTPAAPKQFWKDLSEVSQQRSEYHPGRKVCEAREMMVALPNDLSDGDHHLLVKRIAEEFKDKYGVECAVAIHFNKSKSNYHAHVVFSERKLLKDKKISIAGRDTYFDGEGKRSTKSKCIGADGQLLPGCSLVKKGEAFPVRKFSGKDSSFAARGFCVAEKVRFAEMFNELSKDKWIVYDHKTNPHMRLYNIRRGEPEGLTKWKELENQKIKQYNAAIDRLIESEDLTVEQALKVKQELYEERAAEKEQRIETRKAWQEWYDATAARREAYRERARQEWMRLNYSDSGRRRTTFELLIILGLTIAGVDVFKNDEAIIDENLIVRPPARQLHAKVDPHLQQMVDQLAVAAGRRAPSELQAERKVLKLAGTEESKPSLFEQIQDAESQKRPADKNNTTPTIQR